MPAMSAATQPVPDGAFTLGQRNGHWFFIAPDGQPFFSIGMNHIDSATLRYPENIQIWRDKYNNSEEKWLKEAVAPDLKSWGFNSIGWVQEVVIRGELIHRHSRNFACEQYQWLNMPYCHMLPFAEFHQWEAETRNPDFFHKDFEEWCDCVAREHCARMADDSKLIGYFYIDCPAWVHTRPECKWKGPIFDPKRLETADGHKDLFKLATKYYQVTHDAIRRYDKRHLILGDRYELKAPLPDEVLLAARPFVDVMSFQYFEQPAKVVAGLSRCHKLTGKPVLLADASGGISGSRERPAHEWRAGYEPLIRALREMPESVGLHVCGAYLANRARKSGFRDEQEKVDEKFIAAVTAANRETKEWVGKRANATG